MRVLNLGSQWEIVKICARRLHFFAPPLGDNFVPGPCLASVKEQMYTKYLSPFFISEIDIPVCDGQKLASYCWIELT